MRDPSFRRAQEYYARIRNSAYAAARDDALASGVVDAALRLSACDRHTLAVWRATWAGEHPSGWGGWDWEPLLRRAWKDPAAFHLAIWSEKTLCGLAVGRVSDRDRNGVRSTVSIHFIESAHDPHHPLRRRIAFLTVSAGEAYGKGVGAELLRLIQPLPGVLGAYERLGFETVWEKGRALYCERRIEP